VTKGILAVAVLTPLILIGRGRLAALAESHKIEPEAAAPPTVRLTSLEETIVDAGSRYSAIVKEVRHAELSFRVPGTLEYLLQVEGPGRVPRDLHEGDRVAKGTILARLDPSDYRRERDLAAERLETARARLEQLKSEADLARIELTRADMLLKRNAGTTADLDAARSRAIATAAAVDGASRDTAGAEIELTQAEANLSYCTLEAPFDGATVAARRVDTFERVGANEPAFVLMDLSSLLIDFEVPDSLVGSLAIGQAIEVTAEALPGRKFEGVVHLIGSTADPRTRSYAIELRIDRPEGLRPGMVATAHFRRERRAHLLPVTALTAGAESGMAAVFRVERKGSSTIARLVPVEFEDVLDDRVAVRVESSSSLKPGDPVVAAGVHRLHDGMEVRPEAGD
jgi:RND family efflux transporter MFP subunit